jgi:hypothetical protein
MKQDREESQRHRGQRGAVAVGGILPCSCKAHAARLAGVGSAPGSLVLLPPPDALHQHGMRLLQAALAGLEEAQQGGVHVLVDHQAGGQHTPRGVGVQLEQLLELKEGVVVVRHRSWAGAEGGWANQLTTTTAHRHLSLGGGPLPQPSAGLGDARHTPTRLGGRRRFTTERHAGSGTCKQHPPAGRVRARCWGHGPRR